MFMSVLQVLLGRWKGMLAAVKVLRGSTSVNAAVQERFREEAKNLERLRHPNILDFYGACLEGEQVCNRVVHLANLCYLPDSLHLSLAFP